MAARGVAVPRVVAGATAVLGGSALWLASALSSPTGSRGLALLGGTGVVVLVVALLSRSPSVAAWGLALLGAEVGLRLTARSVPAAAALAGPALLLVAEAGFLSVELHPRLRLAPGALVPRALAVGGLLLGGLALAEASVLVGGAAAGSSGALVVAGAVAAALALGDGARRARRRRRSAQARS